MAGASLQRRFSLSPDLYAYVDSARWASRTPMRPRMERLPEISRSSLAGGGGRNPRSPCVYGPLGFFSLRRRLVCLRPSPVKSFFSDLRTSIALGMLFLGDEWYGVRKDVLALSSPDRTFYGLFRPRWHNDIWPLLFRPRHAFLSNINARIVPLSIRFRSFKISSLFRSARMRRRTPKKRARCFHSRRHLREAFLCHGSWKTALISPLASTRRQGRLRRC